MRVSGEQPVDRGGKSVGDDEFLHQAAREERQSRRCEIAVSRGASRSSWPRIDE